MARISKSEQEAAYRIFNHVEALVGPYYGRKTLDQAVKYVSENRWIMFPEYHIESLRDGAELPIPNVFVSFEDEVADDKTGRANGEMGLTYHNVAAMVWLDAILRRPKKQALFMSLVKNMGDDWSVLIQNKTLTDCPNSTPRYRTFLPFKPSVVTANMLQQGFAQSNLQLLRRGDTYPGSGNPVFWDVTVFVVVKPTTVATFDMDVKKSFDLFFKALSL